jgi:toxin-antitoxin system PIN domain toxin
MTNLLDSNVLIALTVDNHVHHQAAARWWGSNDEPFATCPITQGALTRLLIREGLAAIDAQSALGLLTDHKRHVFWPDRISYRDIDVSGIVGHGQVTDSYLAALARDHRERLATFDRQLAEYSPDVAMLIPVV